MSPYDLTGQLCAICDAPSSMTVELLEIGGDHSRVFHGFCDEHGEPVVRAMTASVRGLVP